MMKVSHGILLTVLMFALVADGILAFLIPLDKQGFQDDLSSPGLDYCVCSGPGKGLPASSPEGNGHLGKRSREVIHYLQHAMDFLPYYRG